MMRTGISLALILSVLGFAVQAQAPLANATSQAPFQLRGMTVTPGRGVPSWPVMAGDPVQAGNSSVTLTFPSGTVVLAPGASVQVNLSGQTPVVQVLGGCVTYQLTAANAINFMQGNNPVTATGNNGQIGTCSRPAGAGWWTPAHIGLVAGAAVGGAVAIATAVNGGSSTSPSR